MQSVWLYVPTSALKLSPNLRQMLKLTPHVTTAGRDPLTSRELVVAPELLVPLDLPAHQE